MEQERKKINIKIIIPVVIIGIIVIAVIMQNNSSEINVSKSDNSDSNIQNSNIIVKTWQDDCLDSTVSGNINYLFQEEGTSGTLDMYYQELLNDFKEKENSYVKKFKEEYENLNYDSLEQIQKDILNGLMYYWESDELEFF